jgi:WD40 repeat protein
MLVIWNAESAVPKRTIFKIPEDQIVSIDISKDCTFIAMLSSQRENSVVKSQKITIWEWRNKAEQIFMCDFEDDEDQEIYELIRFNPNCEDGEIEILTNGKSKILFWNITPSNPEAIRPYFPLKSKGADKKGDANPMNNVNNRQKAITYTQSTFLFRSTMAITATTAGYVIVWDICEALCKENEVRTDRRKIKTVQLIKYKKDTVSDKDIINYLLNYEENIVVGSGDGAIRFYDYNFIIVRWFENVCWLVTSISFDMQVSKSNNHKTASKDGSYTIEGDSLLQDNKESGNTNKFTCKPFITADISATISRVYNKKESLINYNDDNVKYIEIYRGIESNITSLALHPKQQILVYGTDSKSVFKKKKDTKQKESIIREKRFEFKPYIQLFYYPDHMKVIKEEARRREEDVLKKKQLESENINKGNKDLSSLQVKLDDDKQINAFKRYLDSTPTVIEYSLDGEFLMVGTDDEKILVLHPENLSMNLGPPLQIKDITEQGVKSPIYEIIFSPDEKHFAASDTIGRIGLFKNENPYSNSNSDKKEWTLVARHNFKENPVLSFSFCISEKDKFNRLYAICKDKHLYEFEILPNSNYDNYTLQVKSKIMIEHDCNTSSLVSYQPFGVGKDNLIISNDDFKLRTVMLNEQTDPVIKMTCLGPCYGNHIKKLRYVPNHDKDKRILAFNTGSKVFGLILLPLDGNPFRYMGVIGHPNYIHDIKPAKHTNYILTTGGTDFTINGWKYNIAPLHDSILNNGSDLKPFLTLLEGGEDGVKYQEMKNFFYYAQIKSKEENTTKHRTLSETVPNNLIHGLLAAMDYYPSQKEISNIINEISKSDVKSDGVTFDMFVK